MTPTVHLVRHLSEGGMGSLWVAKHKRLDIEVAVKFMAREIGTTEHLRDRFEREARSAARIQSPHVVQIFDHGEMKDGRPYIVMELLEGEDLGALLARKGRLSVRRTALLLSQVAKALTAAHDRKNPVYHRDIKPENIFLTRSGDDVFVKVLDFGIAKNIDARQPNLTATGWVMGTLEYMSPEQLLSPKTADHRTDLWALGAVAYQMLTGSLPFSAETSAGLVVAITRGEFFAPTAVRDDLPRALDDWFRIAMNPDVDERFQSAKDMMASFWRILDEQDPLARSGTYDESSTHDEVWERCEWYVRTADGDSIVGPVTLNQIYRGLKAGKVPPDAEVTKEGSNTWAFASIVLVQAARPSHPPQRDRNVPKTVLQAPVGASALGSTGAGQTEHWDSPPRLPELDFTGDEETLTLNLKGRSSS